MRIELLTLAATLVVVSLAPARLAQAQSTGLSDLVGARAGQAEGELRRRGYRPAGSQQGDDRTYSSWWNADRRQCVTIATMNGRFDSITPTTAPDCGQRAGSERPRDRYRDRPRRDYESSRREYDTPSRDDRRSRGGASDEDLRRMCREEAADRLNYSFDRMYIMSVQRVRTQSIVYGYYQPRGTNEFYYCYFDLDGRMTNFQEPPRRRERRP